MRQFQNPANPAYHASTTGPEILRDFAGATRLLGNRLGGTLSGAGRTLKAARPDLKIIAAEPSKRHYYLVEISHHTNQGWTPDFIPDVLDRDIADQIVPVNEDESMQCAIRLGQEEGIFVGISAGGTLNAALKIAKQAEPGSVILTMLADTAERSFHTLVRRHQRRIGRDCTGL